MSAATQGQEPSGRAAIARSPFPPIADDAFLSNCHTGDWGIGPRPLTREFERKLQ
jgi:hypothetical protein